MDKDKPQLSRIGKFYHSPCIIIIKDYDEVVLEKVQEILVSSGYSRYSKSNQKYNISDQTVFLRTLGGSLYIYDDWYYSMFHEKIFERHIKRAFLSNFLFYGWVGDADESFYVEVIDQGVTIRRLFIYDDWHKITVEVDAGNKLPFEKFNVHECGYESLNAFSNYFGLPLDEETSLSLVFFKKAKALI